MIPLGFFGCGTEVDPLPIQQELRSSVALYLDFDSTAHDKARAGSGFTFGVANKTNITGPGGVAGGGIVYSTNPTIADSRGWGLVHPTLPASFGIWCEFQAATAQNIVNVNVGGSVAFLLSVNSSGVYSAQLSFGGAVKTCTGGSVSAGWHFIVVKCDGVNFTLHVDDVQVDSDTMPATLPQSATVVHQTYIGARISRYFIAHAAISSDAITYLYNGGAGRGYADFSTVAYGTTADTFAATLGLTARWKLNAPSGTTVTDSIGGIGNGTLTGGPTFSSAVDPPAGYSAADNVVSMSGAGKVDLPDVNLSSGSRTMAFGVCMRPSASGNDTVWQLGSAPSSALDSRNIFLPTGGGVSSDVSNGAGSPFASRASSTFTVTLNTWHSVWQVWDDTNLINLCVLNGMVVAAHCPGSGSTAAINLDENYLGSYTSAGFEYSGYLYDAGLMKGAKPTVAQLAKLHDLAVLNSG